MPFLSPGIFFLEVLKSDVRLYKHMLGYMKTHTMEEDEAKADYVRHNKEVLAYVGADKGREVCDAPFSLASSEVGQLRPVPIARCGEWFIEVVQRATRTDVSTTNLSFPPHVRRELPRRGKHLSTANGLCRQEYIKNSQDLTGFRKVCSILSIPFRYTHVLHDKKSSFTFQVVVVVVFSKVNTVSISVQYLLASVDIGPINPVPSCRQATVPPRHARPSGTNI